MSTETKVDGLTFSGTGFVGERMQASGGGTSIFDPVLCEMAYRWFCPPGGVVLDPFAGGSVRGIVAGMLGRKYLGVDLSAPQIDANRKQASEIGGGFEGQNTISEKILTDPEALTPVQEIESIFVKRDDLFGCNGVRGGKVRTCLALAQRGVAGGGDILVTAGSRSSPQVNIVAKVGQHLGVGVRCHTPQGDLGDELLAAQSAGAEIIQHSAGYNSVIIARAREDAQTFGGVEIPFGMECEEAVTQTRKQVANLPRDVERLVMPCGSGMSLAGVLWGLSDFGLNEVKVVAVAVGADPTERLDKYAPKNWRSRVELVASGSDYHTPAPHTLLAGLQLDPYYEAKCLPFLQKKDLFWIVGVRETVVPLRVNWVEPTWVEGDSRDIQTLVPLGTEADFIFSCPPYADLERYSDDPRDLSTLSYDEFRKGMEEVIAASAFLLKEDRFACFVVGDVRGPNGCYRGFPWHTIDAFEKAGLHLYNEAVLVTAVGSLPVRSARAFSVSRKLGKTHQNVLVFVKGDAKRATEACGAVEVALSLPGQEGEATGEES